MPQVLFAIYPGILGLWQGVWLAWCVLHSAARLHKASPYVVMRSRTSTTSTGNVSAAGSAARRSGVAFTDHGGGAAAGDGSRRPSAPHGIAPVAILVGSAPGGTVDLTASNRGLPVDAAGTAAVPVSGRGVASSMPVAASQPVLVVRDAGVVDHVHKGDVGGVVASAPTAAGGGELVAVVAV